MTGPNLGANDGVARTSALDDGTKRTEELDDGIDRKFTASPAALRTIENEGENDD